MRIQGLISFKEQHNDDQHLDRRGSSSHERAYSQLIIAAIARGCIKTNQSRTSSVAVRGMLVSYGTRLYLGTVLQPRRGHVRDDVNLPSTSIISRCFGVAREGACSFRLFSPLLAGTGVIIIVCPFSRASENLQISAAVRDRARSILSGD